MAGTVADRAVPSLVVDHDPDLVAPSPPGHEWWRHAVVYQIYVRSFADATRRIQVSPAGGNEPEWRRDGKELFYLAPDSTLMSVVVGADSNQLNIGAAQPLFQTNAEQERGLRNRYIASPDGQRFLVLSPLVDPNASALVAVLNWSAGLKR